MLRVYLDQAKWIDFAKCRLGRSDAQRYQGAFAVATEAVRLGQASFVLSSAHYFETHRRANWPSRLEGYGRRSRLEESSLCSGGEFGLLGELVEGVLVGAGGGSQWGG